MKSTIVTCTAILALALSLNVAQAADRAAADSLAMSGAAIAAKGNIGQAKEMLYKALANDENCGEAIFELAKIFEKENQNATAGDFYQRALILMSQENKPSTSSKRAEASSRVKALNPFAPRMSAIFEDYAQDLDKLVKKVPDSVTQDAAVARVNDLKLSTVLTAEKMPKFFASAQASKAAAVAAAEAPKRPRRSSFSSNSDDTPSKPVQNVSPEIERELKALGWTTITGSWTKKSTGVYEVTNGKLESPKVNGGIDLWVHKVTGNTGSVRAAVRNDFSNNSGSDFTSSSSSSSSSYYYSSSDYAGYGVVLRPKEFRLYAPGAMTGFYSSSGGGRMEPSHIRSESLVESNPKNHVYVSIMDNVLELSVNDKKSLRYSSKGMPTAGPFVIEVRGTVTIENPRCAGQ